MAWEQWLTFITASLVLFLIPGPDMLLVIGWSATKGVRAGIKASLGTVSGILVHTCATAMGLAALLAASATAFTIVKFAGALYLIYLGVVMLKKKNDSEKIEQVTNSKTSNPFRQALLTNVLNPKVVLFFLAFLPQFVVSETNATSQLFVLGLSFALICTFCYVALIIIACQAGQKIGKNNKVQTVARWIAGSLFIGFGLRLAIASRS